MWFTIFAVAAAGAVIAAIGASLFLYFLVRDLPSIDPLKDYRPSIITKVFADNGDLIGEFYLEDRKVIDVTNLPKYIIQTFVAAEDARFFRHQGIDVPSILRALMKNIEAGHIVQGGSTITQQVAKSLFLTPERSYIRKLKEAVLAYKIDRYLKKYEILNLYLNQIYLGHGAYGIEAAAQRYFGKGAERLTLAEAAMLAGLPKAPSRYSPMLHPRKARSRQTYVLKRMAEDGYITSRELEAALKENVDIAAFRSKEDIAPYFRENVRRYLQERYGSDVLYQEGLSIYTTLNVEMQRAARAAVDRGLRELDKRQGYRGPLGTIPPEEWNAFQEGAEELLGDEFDSGSIVKALVTAVNSDEQKVYLSVGKRLAVMTLENMSWARVPDPEIPPESANVKDPADVLKAGDIVLVRILEIPAPGESVAAAETPPLSVALEQDPIVQGALFCMDPQTGEIKAMVGGRDFAESEYNRATQARRQPGSAFKPIIYTAAFDKGMTAATIIMDNPVIFRDTLKDSLWKPRNFSEKFFGPTTLRTALIQSRNLVTIKMLKDIGIDYAADYAATMGIASPLTRDLSLALGSSAVTLEELVRVYGIFAANGTKANPCFIKKIINRNGAALEEQKPQTEQVVDSRIAYITSHLLQEVVQQGTGWRVRELGRPVAGKTGTTNDLKDASFIGFTPSLVAGVWVGFDDLRPLGQYETGSRAASPIFLYFMQHALAGHPAETFTPPAGVVFAKIDPETGLLARPDAKNFAFACFIEGTEPKEFAPLPGGKQEKEFYKFDLDAFMKSEG
ncbi:MAG: PBP1A family penicillin-binding protein [Deltaproteobacteria bacterium]|nr:PBP1A family penicillin-binding protein [Deltaproteobacteria bacterium]